MIESNPASPERGAAACVFVGVLDSDGRVGDNAAYSPAGTQFQESLIAALSHTELNVSQIFALRPVASFPRDRRLIFGSRRLTLVGAVQATLIGFINLGPLKTISSAITLFPRLIAWAWRERGHRRIILQYNLSSPPGLIAVIAARMTGSCMVPIMADIQVPGAGLLPNTLARRLEFWLQRRTLPLCDGLIVLTRRMANDFAPKVPFIQMEGALPDGLMGARTSHCEEKRIAEPGNHHVLMYSGGLSELKGIPLLLDSFSQLRDEQLSLWITGTGPLRKRVEDSAERDSRITYWGFPTREELLCLYKAADVLVNPHSVRHASARYLFPSKLIEYLGTGVPVISTCSSPEVTEEYAEVLFAVPDDSVEALTETIREVLARPRSELEEFGRRAARYVRTHKTWPIQAQRIARFVLSLQAPR